MRPNSMYTNTTPHSFDNGSKQLSSTSVTLLLSHIVIYFPKQRRIRYWLDFYVKLEGDLF